MRTPALNSFIDLVQKTVGTADISIPVSAKGGH
jgi:hypothetical protein